MAELSPAEKRKLSARLASARQTLVLLQSQLKAGMIEQDYWEARLADLAALLETLAAERSATGEHARLAALYEVSKALGSSLELETVLNQVMDSIIQLTGAERGFLMLFDEGGKLAVKAARNMEQQTLHADEFAISRSVIRAVAETGEQVVTTNAAEDPRFATQDSVVEYNLRSIQCVPLRTRGKIIGVIYVDNRVRSSAFDENDLEMLSAFAAQAAISIENARLFTLTDEALSARVQELSIMQEIDRQLNETLDISNTMRITLDWAVRITEADNGAIGLIDLEEGTTEVIAQHGSDPSNVIAALSRGEHEGLEDGLLTVPIQREGRVVGVIALEQKKKKNFSPEAHSSVLRLADHAAIAIENSRLYQAIKYANDAKSEFVSVMAHELRVPMTSIKGYADMLSLVGDLNEQQSSFLEIIRANVERMSLLVSDLSDIARIEAGRLKVEIEEGVSLKAVVNEVLLSLKGEEERREHTVTLDIPKNLALLRVDPKRLNQVITNLVSNAYKYTPNGGKITIRARNEGKTVRCEVIDSGIGLTAEELEKLFSKFWRADHQYVREQPGTGLGLAIARNLIELQDGEMEVHSTPGEGTTFTFTVPSSKQAAS